ncbi:Thiopurine S-methyltransferase [hydrothermal vent metagenome]|uniref:thiopurine S-methyltransferase n=1 Tax=hydrothermal vent metagenome TaxID=652676 RepID=A0A3B0ZFN7_9ZZZZ
MEASFWQQRWQENKTGFHLDEVNPLLIQYVDKLQLAPGQQVFVPLSGKSHDLIWLAEQGYRVLANELSPVAVEAFFAENNLNSSQMQKGDLTFYQSGLITFVCGDFFKLTPVQMVNVAAVYDRAALIALPQVMRVDYSQHLNLLCPAQPRLLVTLEYEQAQMAGPPFAVLEKEVQAVYANGFKLDCLQRNDVLAEHAHFAAKGLSALHESVYILHHLKVE